MRMRFSSGDLPAALRKEAIEAAFGVHVKGVVDFPSEERVAVDLQLSTLSNVHIAEIATSPLHLITPPDEDGLLYISLTSQGGGVIDARGEGLAVKSGDFTVMGRTGHCTTVVAQPSRILSIAIPRAQVDPRLTSIDCLYTHHPRSPAAIRLLESYATTLMSTEAEFAAEEQATFASHLIDLVVLALGAKRDDEHSATNGGMRAARRSAIKADIARNLGRSELSLAWIATRHGVSESYVRALFYDEGTSFTDHVLAARLDHARTLLASPYLAHHNIATIALMVGFGDISWFNHSFRRRFAMTPSDARAAGTGRARPE